MKRRCLPALLVIASAACFQEFATDPPAAVRAIEHVSPPAVQVVAGGEAPAPTIRLVEQSSREPVADVTVEFLLRPQSGSVANVVARTDANGIATAGKWTLPVQAGEAILDARAAGVSVSPALGIIMDFDDLITNAISILRTDQDAVHPAHIDERAKH